MELNKALKFGNLFSIYGGLLTKKQQEILNAYYNEDLGLSEISEIFGITRQAVLDTINKANETLNKFESILQLENSNNKILKLLSDIEQLSKDESVLNKIEEIKKIL